MSYHNHGTGDTATQSGSVTGLTKDRQAVASSKYQLYGSTKDSTDETGNPYAYNGEARDSTGLDYLRARYYDSQAGTFLTEDSYQGELDDPLSQNPYSYVHNNPVNYTDPSGHFWKSIKRVTSNAWNGVKRVAGNAWNATKKFVGNAWNATKTFVGNAWNATKTFVGNAWNATKTFVGNVWNTATNWFGNQVNGVYQAGQQVYHSASSYAQAQYQQMQAQVQAQQLQAVRHEYAQATGIKGTPKSREARNLLRNWGAALAKTLRHVCTTAKRVGKQIVKAAKKIDWKKVAIVATATVAAVAVTVATAGVAAPFVAGMLGVTSSAVAMGTVGLGTTIAIGAATGAISGAAGGAAYGLVEGTLSGRDSKTTAQNTLNGAVSGFTSGALTGGFGSALTGSTAGLSNPLLRYGADTASETAVDTFVDSATGGNVTPTSIATSLALNAVTEGVSVRGAKGAKADVNTNKPKAGDVPVTKPRKDVTPVQQLALPGPTSKPLALPAPKSTLKTDFYVSPSGDVTPATSPYSYLQDSRYVGAGKEFTATQKKTIIEENMSRNGGVVRSDLSGDILNKPQKSQKGVTPDPNEWQIDHIIPKSKGGSNSYANAQVLSRYENRVKSDKYPGGE